ncbi:ribosylnicotinamide kinase [Varicellaria rhodocarpa]|nr:ribosylnicotinamide kinase [Varicellaria rhodocarpa]
MQQPSSKVVLLGLSGPSSTGKTTLAHLLTHVFPSITLILHGDDFCKEIQHLPVIDGYPDADGPHGVDFVRMAQVLDYVKTNSGKTPTDFKSWQADVFPGQDEIALRLVPLPLIAELHQLVEASTIDFSNLRIVVVEGMMLYSIEEVRERIDARLFLRLSRQTARYRRINRQGYGSEARPGEFWKTEDYFEKMVWQNYKTEHATFFHNGDVEGTPNEEICAATGIMVQPTLDASTETTLRWATDAIISSLRSHNPLM